MYCRLGAIFEHVRGASVPRYLRQFYNTLMRELTDLFAALENSDFRRRFRLGPQERQYLKEKGLVVIINHARGFVHERLAAAHPKNDGRQTPMRGHPVFIAQHATATCCRSCLEKWHGIGKGSCLKDHEIDYMINVLTHWLQRQGESEQDSSVQASSHQQQLFD